MLLSVVINTYERPDRLSRCLEALTRQVGVDPFEVIVVDDGGRPDLRPLERLWSTRLPVRFVRIEHAGRSAARNRGVQEARGERILFLGDDVYPESGCLARHLLHREKKIAVLGPYPCRDLPGSKSFQYWVDPNRQLIVKDPQNAEFFFFLTGNLSMSREFFLELGGFDEQFEIYGWEDTDLGLIFEKAGGRIIYDEQAKAIHEHPMTRAQLWKREYDLGVTCWIFWEKWHKREPELTRKALFWDGPFPIPQSGPMWRRKVGDWLIGVCERFAPNAPFLFGLYERLVFAWRFAGVNDSRNKIEAEGKSK